MKSELNFLASGLKPESLSYFYVSHLEFVLPTVQPDQCVKIYVHVTMSL